jgi:hypothetical protein
LAGLLAPFMRSARFYRRLWPWFERRFGIAEQLLMAPMTEWHEYVLEWQAQHALFRVDGRVVLVAPLPAGRGTRRSLGFVAWLDNQYMVVHPSGRLRHGVVAKSTSQWMELSDLRLEALTP